jgi:hypothetical protein
VKLPVTINLDMEAAAKAFKTLPRDHARDMLQDFLASLDTDSLIYVGRWIEANPIDQKNVEECQRCRRTSYRFRSVLDYTKKVCEYCNGPLP